MSRLRKLLELALLAMLLAALMLPALAIGVVGAANLAELGAELAQAFPIFAALFFAALLLLELVARPWEPAR
jgi:hypothetical protein